MKKIVKWCVVALALVVAGCSSVAYAKDAELVIEFSFDPDYPVQEFRLLCITVPGSAVQKLISHTTDITTREWTTLVTDIPPGKTLDWYLAAVDVDGMETYSPAYKFKLTGRPTIIRIKREK